MLQVPKCAGPGEYLQRTWRIACFKDRDFYECNGVDIAAMTWLYKTIFQCDFPAEVFLGYSVFQFAKLLQLCKMQLSQKHRWREAEPQWSW